MYNEDNGKTEFNENETSQNPLNPSSHTKADELKSKLSDYESHQFIRHPNDESRCITPSHQIKSPE